MTPRARVVLLVVAALVAMASLLVVDGVVSGGGPSAVSALVDGTGGPGVVVATPAKAQPVAVAVRGLSLIVAVSLVPAWFVACQRRRSMRCLSRRLPVSQVSGGK